MSNSKSTGMRVRRLPVLRIIPRIAYYQRRKHAKGVGQRVRLVVTNAQHIVDITVPDTAAAGTGVTKPQRHRKVGRNAIAMLPVEAGDYDGNKVQFKLSPFQDRLGLLPDWAYDQQIESPSGSGKEFCALLMLTVQRKRRERTIIIPITRPTVVTVTVELYGPDGTTRVKKGKARLGGGEWVEADAATGDIVLPNVPETSFTVDIRKASLPPGMKPPPKADRFVNIRNLGTSKVIKINLVNA